MAQAIAQAKANQQEEQDGPIGLLEQSAALGRLSAHSGFVLAAQWMLRLLLIALDCLPVLAKLIGGTTSYDRLVNARLQMRKRMHVLRLSSLDHLLEAVESGDVFCRGDIAAQLWRVSHIAQAKYRAITIGISCSALALACWGSALVLGA